MKVAIVGSRDYARLDLVKAYVDALPKDTVVVSGGTRGVDRFAADHAYKIGLGTEIRFADWDTYGKAAGMMRNTEIVAIATKVVAFWDGQSRGTLDTIRKADKAGKLDVVYGPDGEPTGFEP